MYACTHMATKVHLYMSVHLCVSILYAIHPLSVCVCGGVHVHSLFEDPTAKLVHAYGKHNMYRKR